MLLKKTASVLCALAFAFGAAGTVYSFNTCADLAAYADEKPDEGDPDNEGDTEEGGDFNYGEGETKAQSGTCGANLTWELGTEGTLIIRGKGAMNNYTDEKTPWNDSNTSIKKVLIESGVTSIAGSAFDGCENLTTVSIPSTVASIGAYAFEGTPWLDGKRSSNKMVTVNGIVIDGSGCTGAVSIPNGTKAVASCAFAYNAGITSVTVADSVTYIGDAAFISTGVTKAAIGSGVTYIGAAAFAECASLSSVTFGGSVKEIGESAFMSTALKSVDLPQSVRSIGDYALGYYYSDGGDDDGETKKVSGFKISGYSGTAAETYATKNGFTFNSSGAASTLYGDANCDGSVSMNDILAMQQKLAGWILPKFDETAADVDGNGAFNAQDVIRMQQYFAGWSVKLGK